MDSHEVTVTMTYVDAVCWLENQARGVAEVLFHWANDPNTEEGDTHAMNFIAFSLMEAANKVRDAGTYGAAPANEGTAK